MPLAFFNPREKSLTRANLLVWGSVVASVPLSHFPHIRPTLWLTVPALFTILGTADTVRNIRKRWSLYHAGVIFCLYMDLMAIFLVLFFLVTPYFNLGAHGI
jgi:hypothetical protein